MADTLIIAAALLFVLLVLGAAVWLIRWAWKNDGNSAAMRAGAYVGGGCILLSCAGCPAVLLPVFYQAREAAQRTQCMQNVSEVSRALQMYAADNDDRLPADHWCDAIANSLDPTYFACPSLKNPFGYMFNRDLVAKIMSAIAEPDKVPMVFDGPGGKNSVGPASEAQRRHVKGQAAFGFASGAVRVSEVSQESSPQ